MEAARGRKVSCGHAVSWARLCVSQRCGKGTRVICKTSKGLTHIPNGCVQLTTVMVRSNAAYSVRAPSDKAQACIGRTQERPAVERPTNQPTQRWCSDCGKERANVTGNSARADGLHPSWALGLDSTEAASRWSGRIHLSHPAVAMGNGHVREDAGRVRA